jgi:FKBP-type peptidyl-prolyl cis-trans isomerase FkpA
MKSVVVALVAAAALAGTLHAQNPGAAEVKPAAAANPPAGESKFKSDLEKNSYAMGTMLAADLKRQLSRGGYESDAETIIKAFSDSLRNQSQLMTDTEAGTILREYSSQLRARAEQKRKEEAEKNLKEGQAFLEKNKSEAGIMTTASGLQYKVVKQGEGDKPTTNDIVNVHYRGTLLNGTEFDSSYGKGEPASFGLGRVIRGWTEGLQLMPVGSKYEFWIPSELAYGPNGSPPKIGPNSALRFEVELIGIRPPPPAPPVPPSPVVTSDIIKVPSADELKKGAQIEVIKASDAERIQKEIDAQKKTAKP